MDYQKIYEAIIFKWRMQVPDGYSELHHIVPRCMGGGDESANLIRLPAREHFIAHQCLAKIHKGEFRGKLIVAAFLMSKDGKHGSRDYAWLRTQYQEASRLRNTGNKHSLGFKHSAETRAKWSQQRMGKKQNKRKNTGRKVWNSGKKHSSETIEKMRLAHIGIKPSEKQIELLRQRSKGNNWGVLGKGIKKGPMSQEIKDKIAQTMREVRANKKWRSRFKDGAI
jgi:hypothetical protein